MNTIQILELKKVLKKKVLTDKTDVYRLARPLEIVFPYAVLGKLKAIYAPNDEKGGLFELALVTNTLQAIEFHQIRNTAAKSYHFEPSVTEWNMKVDEILQRGNLPLAVHTHPTMLGYSFYDRKRPNFYLKSSLPDRQVARQGITSQLIMPESIFVSDSRYTKGYSLSLYEGQIFPDSINRLSDAQILTSSGVVLLSLFSRISRLLLTASVFYFFFEFIRRPRYIYSENGLRVKLTS